MPFGDRKNRYININGHGGVYWFDDENIFIQMSEPLSKVPTADEIAEAIERRYENSPEGRRRRIEKIAND